MKRGAFENIVSVCVSVLDFFPFFVCLFFTSGALGLISTQSVLLPCLVVSDFRCYFRFFCFVFLFYYTAVWSVSFGHILVVFNGVCLGGFLKESAYEDIFMSFFLSFFLGLSLCHSAFLDTFCLCLHCLF